MAKKEALIRTAQLICAYVFASAFFLSFYLSIGTEFINFDRHLRCGGWLNFEFK